MSLARPSSTCRSQALPSLVIVLGVALAPAARAAVRWTPIGPNGGTAAMVAVAQSAPEVLYAATTGGVFKSVDHGRTWAALDRTIGRRDVRAVAVDPHDPDVVYAGTASDNVYKSADGGATWRFSGNGVAIASILALAIDPNDPSVVLAGTAAPPANGAAGGIFRSADGGATWHQASVSGLPGAGATSFAFDSFDSRTVYAAAGYVFKSSDGGATWSRLDGAIFAVPADQVLVDPRHAGTVLACNAGNAVRSADAGATWTRLALPDGVPTCPLAFAADGLLYAAGAASTDGGSTWKLTAPLTAGTLSLAADPSSPGTLYAATSERGVYRSADGEGSWQGASNGLRATLILAVAVNPRNDAVVYAGINGVGLLRSRAPVGSTWQASLASQPALVVIDPLRPQNVYAGLFRDGLGDLLASHDGGGTWETVAAETFVFCDGFHLLALDPTSPQTLYAGFGDGCGGDQFGLKSTDGGVTWTPLRGFPTVFSLVVAPRRPSTLYAIGAAALYKSVDAGASWAQAGAGLTGGSPSAVALDPTNPRVLYVATDDSLFTSTDGAAHFRVVARTFSGVRQLLVDPHDPSILYATRVSFDTGVETLIGLFRSADRGRTWASLQPDVLGKRVSALAVDATRANTLFVGTNGAGLYEVTIDSLP
jgi:photosystem II stability/assembly factor-like uncharacterized protein